MTDPGPADPLPFPHFYSPPLAGRDDILVEVYECFESSTHTPLTGRDGMRGAMIAAGMISTHTPLTGRDGDDPGPGRADPYFYSHAPYGT